MLIWSSAVCIIATLTRWRERAGRRKTWKVPKLITYHFLLPTQTIYCYSMLPIAYLSVGPSFTSFFSAFTLIINWVFLSSETMRGAGDNNLSSVELNLIVTIKIWVNSKDVDASEWIKKIRNLPLINSPRNEWRMSQIGLDDAPNHSKERQGVKRASVLRFTRFLYITRHPHSWHLIGSLALISLLEAQSICIRCIGCQYLLMAREWREERFENKKKDAYQRKNRL